MVSLALSRTLYINAHLIQRSNLMHMQPLHNVYSIVSNFANYKNIKHKLVLWPLIWDIMGNPVPGLSLITNVSLPSRYPLLIDFMYYK